MKTVPNDTLESVLVKAVACFFKYFEPLTSTAEVASFVAVSSVSRDFWFQITSRRWNRRLMRHFVESLWKPYQRQARLLGYTDTDEQVHGVAYFEGKIFIGRNSSRPITIHSDVPSYDELDAIKIDGLHRVQDLVVCTESRQLFVADWKCIWSISLGSTGYNAGAVRCIETDCRTWTMSTKNGSLVATTYDVNCLFVYKTSDTVDDLPPKRVQLPDTMFPHHAAATKYESFVISHVQYSSTDGMNMKRYTQVSEVDADGQLIRVYGCGQFVDDLHPRLGDMQYVVLDDDGRAFVADSANRRVLIMTSQPQSERVLLTVECPEKPVVCSRMCYIPSSSQLIVVMALPHRIALYSIA